MRYVVLFALVPAALYAQLTLTSSANPAPYGAPLTFTAAAAGAGTVTFYDGATPLATTPLVGGQATYTTALLPAGNRTLLARSSTGPTATLHQTIGLPPIPANSLRPAVKLSTLTAPYAFPTADVNGDGLADIVVATPAGNTITVFLGIGAGSFRPAVTTPIPAGSFPESLAVVDFDGDGKPDLVLGNFTIAGVSILLGNGDGTFHPLTTLPTPAPVNSVVVADLNGDGQPDIVAAANPPASGLLVFFLNNGDGTFRSSTITVNGVSALIVADLNRDGIPDLVTGSNNSAGLSILLGKGDGTFNPTVVVPAGGSVAAIVAADFDADAIPDIAVTLNTGLLLILRGKGDGTFNPPISYPMPAGPIALVAADFNADGILDLAVSIQNGSVYLLYGNGDATFQPRIKYTLGGFTRALAVADFNADGRLDLAVLDGSNYLIDILTAAELPPTTITLDVSPDTPVNGQPTTLIATVTPASATGTITFSDGLVEFPSLTLSGGRATYTIQLTGGPHPLTASYSGDSFQAPASVQRAEVVVGTPTTVILSASPNPTTPGAVNLFAVVSPTPDQRPITFYDAGKPIGSDVMNNGVTYVLTYIDDPGVHSLTASYPGSTNFAPATSAPLLVTITPSLAPASLTIAASPNPTYGHPVQLTAAVSPATATGTITFYSGATLLGSSTLNNGTASFTTTQLPSGVQTVKARFNGDAALVPSLSDPIAIFVAPSSANGFQPGATLSAGPSPIGAAIADLNNDGIPDLATVSFDSTSVSVLLGRGDGTFAKPVTYPTSSNAASVVVADFNRDGNPDVVTVTQSGAIDMFFGNGDGTLRPPLVLSAGGPSLPILATADFNLDGKPDLAVLRFGTVVILFGTGDGTFQPARNIPIRNSPTGVVIADFNGDGLPDLAFTDNQNTLNVLLHLNDNNFTQTITSTIGANLAAFLTSADFNGDGIPDLAVTSGATGVNILLGTGDGHFQSGATYPAGSLPTAIASADFNGDGIPDLAVSTNLANVLLLTGNGDGTFASHVTLPSNLNARQLVVADLNADGRPDLVAITAASTAAVLLGRQAGSAQLTLTSSTNPSPYSQNLTLTATLTPSTAGSIVFYDGATILGSVPVVNGQATVTTSTLPAGQHNIRAVFLGNAQISEASSPVISQIIGAPVAPATALQPPISYSAGLSPQAVVVADFNRDGKPDFATANYGGTAGGGSVSIGLGLGDGTFRPSVNYPAGSGPIALATGDFNRDSIPDLAVANFLDGTVSILLGSGDGTFQTPVNFPSGQSPISLLAADLNGDGIPDLAITNYLTQNGTVTILLGKGDGTFGPPVSFTAFNFARSIVVADFNRDGIPDLAFTGALSAFASSSVCGVLLGNGDGTFQARVLTSTGLLAYALAVVDFNGDGKPDLAATDYNGARVFVIAGNGDGTFFNPVPYATGTFPRAIVAADLNGDGIPDLAVASFGLAASPAGSLSIILGNPDGTFQPAIAFPTGTNPTALAAGDLNGDGRTDLILTNLTNTVSTYLSTLHDAPAVTLTSTPNPSLFSQRVTLSAAVAGSGSVTFLDAKTVLGTNAVINGKATLAVLLNPGTHPLQARFTPTGGFATSSSPLLTHTVGGTLLAPTTTLTVTQSPFTLTATLSSPNATGFVTFFDSVAILGTAAVSSGQATLSLPQLNQGTHYLNAFYAGDIGNAASTSTVFTYVVPAPPATTYQPAATLTTGRAPLAIAAADFNRDGIPDLAVVNSGDNTVSIFFGNADGTWRPRINHPTGATPVALAIADFNRDGVPDLVVVNSGANNLSVLFGNSDGTFQPPATLTAGLGPSAVAVADFNHDGIPDLAVLNQTSQDFSILLGNGDGTFQAPLSRYIANAHTAFTIADVNNDGKPDLLIAVAGDLGGSVYIYTGNGDGSFALPAQYTLGAATGPFAITTGDLLNNGGVGFAVAGYEGVVYRRPGDGRGGFAAQTTYTAGLHPWAITTLGPDLVVANNGDNTLTLLRDQTTVPTGISPVAILVAQTNLLSVNYADNTVTVLQPR